MNTPYTSDDLLMMRLQDHDPRAFEELVSLWQRPLMGFFYRNTRDEHLSEDLVQETLLRLYRNSWDYLPRGLFKGFLFRIARNLLIDHSRRSVHDVLIRRIQPRTSDGDELPDVMQLVPDDMLAPEGKAIEREVAQIIQDLIQQLPDEQRQTFMMHYYDGLTLADVAAAMGSNLPTAKSRLRLAREKLKYLLVCRGFPEEYFFENVSSDP